MPRVTDAVRKKSRLTKEEWREYTKTVWHVANVSHDEHPAVYMLLMPGDPGHEEMYTLTEQLPNVGKGRPRVIADSADIRGSWAACPLLMAIDRNVDLGLAV